MVESGQQRALKDQMAVRETPVWEQFGPDPERRALAQRVGELVQEIFQWPQPHFIPEDSFHVALWGLYGAGWVDNLELEEFFLRMEDLLGIALDEGLLDELDGLRFDEAVGVFLALKQGTRSVELLKPLTPENAPERKPCPALAAFLEIRAYLQRPVLLGKLPLRPSNRIGELLAPDVQRKLQRFVQRRFGVSVEVARVDWQDPMLLSLSAAAIAGTLILIPGLLATGTLFRADIWGVAFGFALFALAVTAPCWLAGLWGGVRTWRRRKTQVETLGDLVRAVLAERRGTHV